MSYLIIGYMADFGLENKVTSLLVQLQYGLN